MSDHQSEARRFDDADAVRGDTSNVRTLLGELTLDREAAPGRRGGGRFVTVAIGFITCAGVVAAYLLWPYGQWQSMPNADARSSTGESQNPPLQAQRADTGPGSTSAPQASPVLDASGYVVARRQATLSAQTGGQLEAIYVEAGSTVAKGELIAELDASIPAGEHSLAEAQAGLVRRQAEQTRIRLEKARHRLERVNKLKADGFTSDETLEDARFAVESLAAELRTSRDEIEVAAKRVAIRQEQLDKSRIEAPFDGVVIEMDAHVGEVVVPINASGGYAPSGICTLVDLESLEGEVLINEQYIGRVQRGQPVQIRAPAYPELVLDGEVIAVMPSADRQTGAVKVRIGFSDEANRLLPDMGIDVAFLEAEEQLGQQGPGPDHEQALLATGREASVDPDRERGDKR